MPLVMPDLKRITILTIHQWLSCWYRRIDRNIRVVGRYEPGFNAGLGFITIALLARTNPIVIPALY